MSISQNVHRLIERWFSGHASPNVTVQTSSGAFSVDAVTGALVTITLPHHEVHEGEAFVASYKSPDASPVADNANLDLRFATTTKVAHVTFQVAGGGDFEFFLYEAGNVTGGTALSEVNMNRISSNASTITVTHTPVVNTLGTQLENFFIPGGKAAGSNGGAGGRVLEWNFATSTTYLFRLTNRAGTAQPLGIVIEWYEEDA